MSAPERTDDTRVESAARAPEYAAYLEVLLQVMEVSTLAGQNYLSSAEDEAETLVRTVQDVAGLPPDMRAELSDQARALFDNLRGRSKFDRDHRDTVLACYR